MGEVSAGLRQPKRQRPAALQAEAASARLLAEHTVAYPGDEGSLAHIAATQFFKNFPQTLLLGVSSIANAFQAVSGGEALYGVIPIENSASGTLHTTYDLLVSHDVVIGAELGMRESYCLCAQEGVQMGSVRTVMSHPNILEACSSFLENRLHPTHDLVYTRSTTEAARRVAESATRSSGSSAALSAASSGSEGSRPALAAVATREAAARHGLRAVAEDIANEAFPETRYILIHSRSGMAASRPSPFPREALSPVVKRSGCFALRNEPGAIFKLLSCWALRGIDVLKVETRPLAAGRRAPPGLPAGIVRLWDYLFYVDYIVPPGWPQEAADRLAASLREFSLWQCDFGAYPSLLTHAEKQAQSWDEMLDLMAKS